MDNIIEVKNVNYSYSGQEEEKKDILSDFSVSFERGSFTAILGHNGSGKSTLARLLNGLNKPNSGSVSVNGLDTSDEKNDIEIKKTVGLVFQNPDNQIIASVVEEDVAFGPENLGIEPTEIRKRVDDALKTVDMYDYRLYAPHNLSGGQKQRVAIAGILAMQPQCLVLDEPTAMLDPKGRQDVINTVYRLNEESGITVILITHYMEEAVNADRVIVMNDGKIISDATPRETFGKYELLCSAGLSVPQSTELIYKLSKSGLKIRNDIISEDEAVEEIYNVLK